MSKSFDALIPSVPALQRAMTLLGIGFSVIPIVATGKTPLAKWTEYQRRLPTPEELHRLFRGNGDANVGLVTGAVSRVVVVDTDNAEAEAWAREHLPSSRMQTQTAKGLHHYYRHPGSAISNRAGITVAGGKLRLDVRGDGGYVVAPGSTHESGAVYKAVGDWSQEGIASLPTFDPSWLKQWAEPGHADEGLQEHEASERTKRGKTRPRRDGTASIGEAGDGLVHEGERNNTAFDLACRFRRQGVSEERALQHLVDWNQHDVHPPLPMEELEKCLASAYRPEYREQDDAVDDCSLLVPGTIEVGGLNGSVYQLGPRGLYRKTSPRAKQSRQIASFYLQVQAERAVHRPAGVTQELDLAVIRGDTRTPFTLPAEAFADNRQLKAALMNAAGASLDWSDRDFSHLRSAAVRGSRPQQVQVFQTFGLVGDRHFVSPSVEIREGQIITEGRSLCELTHIPNSTVQHLDLKALPPEKVDAALRAVYETFVPQFHPIVSLTLLSLVALAPTMDQWKAVYNPYVLFLRGASGVRKSTAAAFTQAFFGSFVDKGRLLSFSSTVNALEGVGALLGGTLMVIDDFKRQNLTSPEAASKLLQTYADQSGRDRMNRSADLQASRRIRGLLVVTGEDVPEGETSVTARCIRIDMDRRGAALPDRDITELWRRCRDAAEDFRGITPVLVAWLQRQSRTYIQDLARRYMESFGNFIQQAAPELRDNRFRVTSNFSLSLAGTRAFLDFSVERAVLSPSEANDLMLRHEVDMRELLLEHAERVPQDRPGETFLEALRGLLASREARILPVSQRGTSGNRAYSSYEDPESYRTAVGYWCVKTREIFLLPTPALDKVKESLRRAGRSLAFSHTAIKEDLEHLGYLLAGPEQGRQTTRVIIDGHRVRVWSLTAKAEVMAETTGGDYGHEDEPLDIIEPDDDSGPGGPDGPPDG